jgi:hypothetical protein
MKSLVYVSKYKTTGKSPVEPENGRVYLASDDGEFWCLEIDDVANFTIHKKLCIKITEQNIADYQYNEADEVLIRSFMATEMGIATAVKEVREDDDKRAAILSQSLGMIVALDPMMGDALASLLSHIAGTYGDKYEDDGCPLVDIYGLKYGGGLVSSGFNVGNAIKYLKRYLTYGYEKSYNPTDLKKAIQFLLFELVNRETDEESKT